MGWMVSPRQDEPDAAFRERADQRYIGDRDLTVWPSAGGHALVRLAQRLHRRLASRNVLVVILLVGLALVAALTAAAGAVYDAVVEEDGIAALDHPALDAAKAARTPQLTTLVQAFTSLGGGIGMPILATVFAVGLAVAWRQWTPVLLIAATAAGSLTLTVVGKAVVGRVRPALADAVPPYELSASFPSGHTLNAVALAGIVAYLLVRRQRRARSRIVTISCAGLFALAMGLSRIYLGHHWLTDVLVAWALGLGWLAVVITAHRLLLTLRKRDDTARPPGPALPTPDA
jgi:membrane-associated phospholipid phosphatase